MIADRGQTQTKRLIAFWDNPPIGGGSGMPCGACRGFLFQLNEANEDTEIMVDFATRERLSPSKS